MNLKLFTIDPLKNLGAIFMNILIFILSMFNPVVGVLNISVQNSTAANEIRYVCTTPFGTEFEVLNHVSSNYNSYLKTSNTTYYYYGKNLNSEFLYKAKKEERYIRVNQVDDSLTLMYFHSPNVVMIAKCTKQPS